MVDVGEDQRVREQRVFMQAATAHLFIDAVDELTGRICGAGRRPEASIAGFLI